MATNNRAIQTIVNTELKTLAITTDVGVLTIHLNDLEPGIITHATLHGLKQKIVDAAAIGAGATITEKYNAMKEVAERLTGDEPSWNKGAGSGAGNVRGGLLFNALCQYKPNTPVEDIRTYLSGKTPSEQSALRKVPAIASIIETIKAESVNTSGIDADELLGDLDDI